MTWSQIPYSNGTIVAARNKTQAIRADGETINRARVPGEYKQFLASCGIPYYYFSIGPRCGKTRAVRAKRNTIYFTFMTRQGKYFSAGVCIPNIGSISADG